MASIIGITTSFEEGQQRLHHTYVKAVEKAGGIPLPIPMVDTPKALKFIVNSIHGLIVTGGPAITEGVIGDLPKDLDKTAPERAQSDTLLLDLFEKTGKPLLGICYGMQLINARDGGTIFSDVQAQVPNALVHSSVRGAPDHVIEIEEDSTLFNVLRTRSITVNSRHIQAIADVGKSFRITAKAPDGVPEAIENASGSVLGVQFHPERMGETMAPLFEHFVQRAQSSTLLNVSTL